MKIGIVNDMPLAIEVMRRTLAASSTHEVIWTAQNGMEAVAQCARQVPDLVLMDLFMPGMGGVEATRRIMESTPCAILIVTVNVGTNASEVFEAMGYGALDAIDTPQLGGNKTGILGAEFLNKINAVERMVQERGIRQPSRPARHVTASSRSVPATDLVAIGASAGGPAALQAILRQLPRNLRAAVVIVQHVDERFVPDMVSWLGQTSPLPIRLAQENDIPLAGQVFFAGTGGHLALKDKLHLGYVDEPKECAYRPSIDVFFYSVCRHWRGNVTGVLLTGMGRDGARGLKELRNQGHYTIAQDKESSAVYGMPKAAAELDAAIDIMPISMIGATLVQTFSGKSE